LETLAKGCLCDNPNKLLLDDELGNDLKIVVSFCDAYYQVMQNKRLVLGMCALFSIRALILQLEEFLWFTRFYSFHQLYKTEAPRLWLCNSKACVEISRAQF